jgi:RNA polymerase sigma factor (TIGR02999 family)
MSGPSGEITLILQRLKRGDHDAHQELFSLVYEELRRMAAHYMRSERPDHTLQATALVHEAFLRLMGGAQIQWQDRAHFFAVAAQTMRRILVDHARVLNANKRIHRSRKVSLDAAVIGSDEQAADVLALDEALARLAQWDARQCSIVEMRFFGGLENDEIAEVLGVSPRTVKRDWSLARAWLYGELTK